MQVRGCYFNIGICILPCSVFGSKDPATVDSYKITIRKLVSVLRLSLFFIDPQKPSPILTKPMLPEKLIFLLGGWLVLTPGIFVIQHIGASLDELFSVVKCPLVQFYCHSVAFPVSVAKVP